MSEADFYDPPKSTTPGRKRPSNKGYPLWVKVFLGFAIGIPLVVVLTCAGMIWSVESKLPPRAAHPSTDALFSSDPGETRRELRWAAEAALQNARGQLSGERGGGSYSTLARGRFCAYDVYDKARGVLRRVPADAELREVSLLADDGSVYPGPPASHAKSMTWLLEATLGGQRLHFEFEWHDLAMGSSLNLESVKVLGGQVEPRKR